jgi:hypothetical protein
MSIRPRAVLALCALLIASRADAQFRAADPAPGEQFHAELSLLFWTPTPEIKLSTDGLDTLGVGQVDFVKEFNIENKRFREFRVTLKPGHKHKIRFGNIPINYTQTATLTRTVTFGGLTVPVSTTATFDMKWDVRRYGYEYDFVARDRGYLGVIAELKDNKVSATVTSPSFGTETTDHRAPVPTIGIAARGYPHRLFSITGELTGVKVPGSLKDQLQGKLFDFDLYGTLSFGKNVAVQGGYRSLLVDYIVDNGSGRLKMKGMYWGGLVRF